jgi:hypothetical protein
MQMILPGLVTFLFNANYVQVFMWRMVDKLVGGLDEEHSGQPVVNTIIRITFVNLLYRCLPLFTELVRSE